MVALFTIQHLSVGVISALFSRAGAFEKVHKDDVSSLLQRLVVFPLLMMSERKLEMDDLEMEIRAACREV
jgi:hypothetical protein